MALSNDGQSFSLLPFDLTIEILSRLPVKFKARCRCVSKLWSWTIRSPEFTELVLTRSATTQPQVLLACKKHSKVLFYSSPQNPSPVVPADDHMSFPFGNEDSIRHAVHGLVCLEHIHKKDKVLVICNPRTGQSLTIPKVKTKRDTVRNCFGYDPVGKQFKMLSMSTTFSGGNCVSEILTLGNGQLSWRTIECTIPQHQETGFSRGLCIDGVVYYQADVKGCGGKFMIVCFHRSEKFSLIKENDTIREGKLINYKGKLATVRSEDWFGAICVESKCLEFCVLEDAEKNEWSAHTYVLPPSLRDLVSPCGMVINGVTITGEMVLSPAEHQSDCFYLLYYNLESKTTVKFEIQGIDASEYDEVLTFIDHVEDVKLGGVFQTS